MPGALNLMHMPVKVMNEDKAAFTEEVIEAHHLSKARLWLSVQKHELILFVRDECAYIFEVGTNLISKLKPGDALFGYFVYLSQKLIGIKVTNAIVFESHSHITSTNTPMG